MLSHADGLTEELTKDGANIWIFLITSILLWEKVFRAEVIFFFLNLGKFTFLKLSILPHFWLSAVDIGIGILEKFFHIAFQWSVSPGTGELSFPANAPVPLGMHCDESEGVEEGGRLRGWLPTITTSHLPLLPLFFMACCLTWSFPFPLPCVTLLPPRFSDLLSSSSML